MTPEQTTPSFEAGMGSTLVSAIRPVVLAIVRRDIDRADGGDLLVYQGHDPTRDLTFFRPLGGGVEFGELLTEAVAREMREEFPLCQPWVRRLPPDNQ